MKMIMVIFISIVNIHLFNIYSTIDINSNSSKNTDISSYSFLVTNKPLTIILITISLVILVAGVILISNTIKLIKRNKELINYNELRNVFIDADDSFIFLKDDKLKYVFANKAFRDVYNIDLQDIVGKTDYELLNKTSADIYNKMDLEVLNNKVSINKTEMYKDKVVETSKFPVKLLNGKIGVGAYIKDITLEYKNKSELMKLNEELQENKQKLKLILNSTVEGIFGIDINGVCTFCNNSCLEMLRYQNENELIEKNIVDLITTEKSILRESLGKGNVEHADDEEFIKLDGTRINVEYFCCPQFNEGEQVGYVVTFIDVTEKKIAEKEKLYFVYNDYLTGLYNRRYMEEQISILESNSTSPISVIVGDVNGLKFINDVFGHTAGDDLLVTFASILKQVCDDNQILIRLGGDEFIIILPNTNKTKANKIIDSIKNEINKINNKKYILSVSFGCKSKTKASDKFIEVFNAADDIMYTQKLNSKIDFEEKIFSHIKDNLFKDKYERIHSETVGFLSMRIAQELGMSIREVEEVRLAAELHDIGKIATNSDPKRHPEIGYRILQFLSKYPNICEFVLYHHEYVNGQGFPRGLSRSEIPLQSKIICVAEVYDSMVRKDNLAIDVVVKYLKGKSNIIFDIDVTKIFIEKVLSLDWNDI